MVLRISPVAIIDLQLPFEYTITSRSTDVVVVRQPLPAAPAADSDAQVLAKWNALYDAYNAVACLMLGSMTPEVHRQFENYSPYEMLHELKSMFEKQAGVKRFCGIVRNYNMHNMRKTIGELHAMLIEYENGLSKKAEIPQVMMIKGGKIQKAKKKSLKAKGKGKAKDGTYHHYKEGSLEEELSCYLAELLKKKKQVGSASSLGIFTIELFAFLNKSWVYDTGCGTHICITKQGFREARKVKQGALYLYVSNGVRAQVEAIGSFALIFPNGLVICLDNCHYTPFITRCVVSVYRLVENGVVQCFTDYGISVSKNNVFYFNAIPSNGIYEIDMHDLVPNVNSIYNVSTKRAKHNMDSTYLWHCRLAHISKKRIKKLQQEGHVPRQGASYFITFTDNYSRYDYVYLLKHKHEVFETFKVFKNEVENQLTKTIKALRSDRGGEYITQEFYLKACGIVQQLTSPYTPQHNGVSERRNRTLLDMVRSMMNLTTPPLSFWDYALESATRILNMVPTKKVDKTPYEFWYGKVPNLSYLKKSVGGQDEDTSPSEITSEIPMEVKGFEPPQEEGIPIRRSERTHRAPDRLCLNVKVEEYSLGDLNEPASYKAAILASKSNKWIDAVNAKIQSMMDNMVWVDLPPSCKTVGSKWIFKKKTDMDGFVDPNHPRKVCKLQRSIYGLKQTSRSWNKIFDEKIKRDDTKSQTGYVFISNEGAVDWKNSKQSTTAISATEAEYIADSKAAMEVVWIRKFILGLGMVPTINEPIRMFCDNSAALHFTNEPGVQRGTRHYHRRYHYVRVSIALGKIRFLTVHTDDNLADPFTKALSNTKLIQHKALKGLLLPDGGPIVSLQSSIKLKYGSSWIPPSAREISRNEKASWKLQTRASQPEFCTYSTMSFPPYHTESRGSGGSAPGSKVQGAASPGRVKGAEPLAGVKFPESVKDMTSNFDKLAKKLHFLLTTLKVVYVLSTPSPVWSEKETLETTKKRMKWENDYICRGHILNGMSDSLFDIYQNAEFAKALWESLESKYMALWESLQKHYYTQHNLMMDDAISVALIIDKLPPSWKEFKHEQNLMREGRLRWFRHVKRRPQTAPIRRVEALLVEGSRRRDRPKLIREDRLKLNMKEILLFEDMIFDRNALRDRIRISGLFCGPIMGSILPWVYDDVGCLFDLFHSLSLSITLMHTYTGRRSPRISLFTSGFILELGVGSVYISPPPYTASAGLGMLYIKVTTIKTFKKGKLNNVYVVGKLILYYMTGCSFEFESDNPLESLYMLPDDAREAKELITKILNREIVYDAHFINSFSLWILVMFRAIVYFCILKRESHSTDEKCRHPYIHFYELDEGSEVEGQGESWHGHATAVTVVAPRQQLAMKLMNLLEDINDKI
uniref:Integrase catalytic domain-containing protein n=1 Tax=Tanacetum cinerariifolium TaxID=118510 RepID=A0A6L2JPJ9_TANCI|nr:hypothetical protein [Tanacetum cinerariifolium]